MITHDLPYALELCPRSVLMNRGAVIADGPTPEIMADTELMSANRMELPYGFDPGREPGPRHLLAEGSLHPRHVASKEVENDSLLTDFFVDVE